MAYEVTPEALANVRAAQSMDDSLAAAKRSISGLAGSIRDAAEKSAGALSMLQGVDGVPSSDELAAFKQAELYPALDSVAASLDAISDGNVRGLCKAALLYVANSISD